MKEKNNDQLGERLLAGDISPKELVSMKPEGRIKQVQQQIIHNGDRHVCPTVGFGQDDLRIAARFSVHLQSANESDLAA
ncbi:hypothetical protein HK405_015229 [Cladochytrium tenue]|nr:hypothetical protein HK405_015229 [Cladochytrium tenue]